MGIVGFFATSSIQSGCGLLIGNDYNLLNIINDNHAFLAPNQQGGVLPGATLHRMFLDETSVKHQASKTLFPARAATILIAQRTLIVQFIRAGRKSTTR
jgi:hypothetical protein